MKNFAFLFGAALTVVACAKATEPSPGESSLASEACEAQCDCIDCTDGQMDKCQDDMEAFEEVADERDCEDELDDYLSCMNDDAECLSGFFDNTPCLTHEQALLVCLGNTGGCEYQNDGKCDEPEGSGLCEDGTDAFDCGTEGCAFTYNGICDEPEGTGLCLEGEDFADCTAVCEHQNDGYCDEPEGSGLCVEGSDAYDCAGTGTCPYTNDGYCDEPEGTGICPEGSDVVDCSGSGECSSCYEYVSGTSTDPLCPASQALLDAVIDCICVTGCESECYTACGGGEMDSYCESCANYTCSSEMTACTNDF